MTRAKSRQMHFRGQGGGELHVEDNQGGASAGLFEDLRPAILVQGGTRRPLWAQSYWPVHDHDLEVEEELTLESRRTAAAEREAIGPDRHPLVGADDNLLLRRWQPMVPLRSLVRAEGKAGRALLGDDVRFRMLLDAARALEGCEARSPGAVDPDEPWALPFTAAGAPALRMKLDQNRMDRWEPSRAGVLQGNFDGMSPEEVRGMARSPATVVWRLGHLLYHFVLPARPPAFRRDSAFKVLEAIVRNELPALPQELPARLRQLLVSSWARDPQSRVPTPSAFIAELLQALPEEPSTRERVGSSLQALFGDVFAAQRATISALDATVAAAGAATTGAGADEDAWEGQTEQHVVVNDAHRRSVQVDVGARRILLDEHLVTRADYALFALETGADRGVSAHGRPDAPMVDVTRDQASAYAAWARKRLPVREELQAAWSMGVLQTQADRELSQWTAPAAAEDRGVWSRVKGWLSPSSTVGFRCAVDLA